MPAMRVHELAKEFGMTSKELLDRLAELRIPAKNHASTLVDAYVDKIRKQLGPEIAERQSQLAEERAKEEAAAAIKAVEDEVARKAAEDERRKAEEAERARRDEEQRIRAEEAERRRAEEEATRNPVAAPAPVKAAVVTTAPVVPAASAASAAKPARAAVAAASAPAAAVEAAPVAAPVAPVLGNKPNPRANLEAAIAAERDRLAAEEAEALGKDEEDRYRKMAVEAEELQRQKVLDEAKAAVAAAAVEGSRKKKKHKKPVGADVEDEQHHESATHTELPVGGAAVTVTEGITVGDFADALDVPANNIIKRLFLLGTPLTVNQAMSTDIIVNFIL